MPVNLKSRFAARLAQELVGRGAVTEAELAPFRERAAREGRCLADLLVAENAVERTEVLNAAGRALGLSSISLSEKSSDAAIRDILPARVAHALRVIPLFVVENEATFAMADPFDLEKIDELGFRVGKAVIPVFALGSDVDEYLELFYGPREEETANAGTIEYEEEPVSGEEAGDAEPHAARLDGRDEAGDAGRLLDEMTRHFGGDSNPVVRLVDLILTIALEDAATDVHIEPRGSAVVVRNRIDGLLVEKPSKIPPDASRAIVSRIKVLAGLDITERSLPQDGKIALRYEGRNIDVRVSTFPTIRGEKVVLRILDRSRGCQDLGHLGFSAEDLESWKELLTVRDGLILVTGPTGCGKTSTLYASLRHIKSPELNIVTLEDPVEYDEAEFAQAQVNNARGFTFSGGLRSILRQDPDVILVGEIRDLETAQIAVQAALTGHLVLATLHTNDAASAVTRLADIGLVPYLIAAALRGVLAQRLVRRLCRRCRRPAEGAEPGEQACAECGGSGYKGRVGIYELLTIDRDLREAIARGSHEFHRAVADKGVASLWEDGMRKVQDGVTDLAELKRVVPEAVLERGTRDRGWPEPRAGGAVPAPAKPNEQPNEQPNGPASAQTFPRADAESEHLIRLLIANDLGAPA